MTDGSFREFRIEIIGLFRIHEIRVNAIRTIELIFRERSTRRILFLASWEKRGEVSRFKGKGDKAKHAIIGDSHGILEQTLMRNWHGLMNYEFARCAAVKRL